MTSLRNKKIQIGIALNLDFHETREKLNYWKNIGKFLYPAACRYTWMDYDNNNRYVSHSGSINDYYYEIKDLEWMEQKNLENIQEDLDFWLYETNPDYDENAEDSNFSTLNDRIYFSAIRYNVI